MPARFLAGGGFPKGKEYPHAWCRGAEGQCPLAAGDLVAGRLAGRSRREPKGSLAAGRGRPDCFAGRGIKSALCRGRGSVMPFGRAVSFRFVPALPRPTPGLAGPRARPGPDASSCRPRHRVSACRLAALSSGNPARPGGASPSAGAWGREGTLTRLEIRVS